MTELDLQRGTSKGWFYGTSWQRGLTGLFPGNYVEVAPESDCWVLHRTCYLYNKNEVVPQFRKTLKKKQAHEYEEAQTAYQSDDLLAKSHVYSKVKRVDKPHVKTQQSVPSPVPKPQGPNRIFIFRHAERVDATFGQNWIRCSFDKEGNYERKNLNMPISLPKREGGPEKYNKDSPITMMGQFQSRITGEGMRDEGVRITHAFSSPSLRCVQTAQHILEGIGAERSVGINVEPGLFEWMAWARGKIPDWMKPEDLLISGLNVDRSYKYIEHPNNLSLEERADDYYRRSYDVIRKIIHYIPSNTASDVLILAHAGSLDALSRMLIGQLPRSAQELTQYTQQVPYAGCCMLEEAEGGWKLTPPPFNTLIHGPNKKFDWRDMML
ncbi:Ubiquitin-associated and SH3 domain-containing protein B-like [Oopsacas minuta]|uniref:Ubiquitin-associated and SH3 domain-containing protein B-like n=1 Tax=Oopsacas minuta TaxID=111878 RepID=A0AAV7K4X0_9METZ|nr:Ubiquitin-associated and SH3 domain-containing protein B-like [Oopsacas minuta]